MTRYTVERGRRSARILWRRPARLRDRQTGAELEFMSTQAAAVARAALELAETGNLEARPADASPFLRYDVVAANGWYWINRGEGALTEELVARTRSSEFATRAVIALNRASPRRLRDPHGPAKAGWF